MGSKRILFIINPISGGKNKAKLPALIEKTLDKSKYKIEIAFTTGPFHAKELAKQQGYDCFVAVGGDGTINEVASQLIHAEAVMGILPMGSGNGLARHLGISMNIEKAIAQLNSAKIATIDTCTVNGRPFINMAGVGFDAHIGQMFAESTKRGFKTYIMQTLTAFNTYKPQHYKIIYDQKLLSSDAFLVSFANSSQYGNNAYIAPAADLMDGLLDICVLKPFNAADVLGIGYRLFSKTIMQSKYFETVKAKEIVLERETDGVAHLDGEPMVFGKKLEIKVVPASLKLLVP